MWKAVTGVCIAVLVLLYAFTAEAAECSALSEVRAKAAAASARVAYIDDTRTTQAMNAFYNAQPPESSETFSTVYVVTYPGGMSQILLGSGDQICGGFNMPTEALNELLQRMMGVSL